MPVQVPVDYAHHWLHSHCNLHHFEYFRSTTTSAPPYEGRSTEPRCVQAGLVYHICDELVRWVPRAVYRSDLLSQE